MKDDTQTKERQRPIRSWKDPRVSCFHSAEYKVKEINAIALAYFIQFAIRIDLRNAVGSHLQKDYSRIRLSGYLELEERMQDILSLIRTRHIVDERDLATIDLSLYDFPTICHFLDGTGRPVFVREATVKEIRSGLEFAYSRVFESDIWEYASSDNTRAASPDDVDPDAVHAIIDRMSLTQLQRESQRRNDPVADERLFVVDLTAPVSLLTKQFLAALDRMPKQKVTMGADFSDLADLGILPYIDLEDWQRWVHGSRINRAIQVELIYLSEGSTRKLTDRTIRLSEKMLDANSTPFTYLISKAADELDGVRERLRQRKPETDAVSPADQSPAKGNATDGRISALKETTDEILTRWLPRTYPFNISDLKRAALVFPDEAAGLRTALELAEQGMNRSISDRIQDSAVSASDGSVLVRVLREMHQANEPK